MTDQFSPEERATLSPYFTNLDGPVFALVNLPEVVKGALFARYSRSPKSLRRLFLDEFLTSGTLAGAPAAPFDTKRADELYGRMFFEYGDDSVAQLGGVHLACEGASNILTKVLEWGRLAAYLEQSTRYVPYDDLVDGRYRYHVPRELEGDLRNRYVGTLDAMFDTYRELLPILRQHFADRFPRDAQTSDAAYRMSIRAKALDTLRGLLPAATTSNVGIYGSGQAYENLLIRMRAHPLLEVRAYADMMLVELRKVIPAFLRRVDLLDRGGAWSSYLDETRRTTSRVAAALLAEEGATPRDEVTLTDFDPDGEVKVVAAVAAGRARHAGGHRRSGRRGSPASIPRRLGRAARRDRGRGIGRGGALRRGHGVPAALLHGDERAGGDAPHRAAQRAAGPPVLPPYRADDAPAHRRAGRAPRAGGGHDVRRPLGGRARASGGRAGGGEVGRGTLTTG